MNSFVVSIAVCLIAVCNAAPSGIHGLGAVVSGPAGIVTSHGAVGPIGALGLGHGAIIGAGHGVGAAVIAAPAAASAVVAGPAAIGAHGLGLGWGGIGLGGLGLGIAHGAGVITNGGGAIGVSGHGATVQGPPTAPVVVAGPAGKIAADGLWGPTANIGHGAHGWGHGW